jgi:hypothetical protein
VTEFQPLQALAQLLGQSGPLPPVMFPPNSRYAGVEVAMHPGPDGTEVAYLRRRFVPQPSDSAAAGTYTVAEADRLDNVAFQLLGDPELFWRLCDANRAMVPTELQEVGRMLIVPLPPGVPAPKAEA